MKSLLLDKPTDVVEVLTVNQVLVLRVHAVSHFVAAGEVDARGKVEGVEVTFVFHHVHGEYLVDRVLAIDARGEYNEVNADGIVETLLVHHVRHAELLAAHK